MYEHFHHFYKYDKLINIFFFLKKKKLTDGKVMKLYQFVRSLCDHQGYMFNKSFDQVCITWRDYFHMIFID